MATAVVTGMGAVSPLGVTLAASWQACRDGQGAIAAGEITPGEFGPPAFAMPLARVPENPVSALEAALGRKIGASLDPFAVYALASTAEAIAASGLDRAALSSAAIIFGHGFGGLHTLDESYARFYGRRVARLHPMTIPKVMVSAPASAIAMEFGVRGPVFAVSSACASSGHAIAQGAALIESGRTEIAIVGGAEAIATPGCLAAWDGLRAVSPTTCRPFSAGRDGMAIGEGGACLVLESAAHATARGATVIATLAGYGMTSDAHHWTQPTLDGALGAMRQACAGHLMEEEGLLISTHGTGTPLNDENEAAAINTLFGAHAKVHHVIATKSAHGHLIGASTALQAALGLCALRDGVAPPVLNYLGPDPACDLNLVLGAARRIDSRALLVNSFAFGGLNVALAFRR